MSYVEYIEISAEPHGYTIINTLNNDRIDINYEFLEVCDLCKELVGIDRIILDKNGVNFYCGKCL